MKNRDGTEIKEKDEACQSGAHPSSTWDGPGRWRCETCNQVWYGPNY